MIRKISEAVDRFKIIKMNAFYVPLFACNLSILDALSPDVNIEQLLIGETIIDERTSAG